MPDGGTHTTQREAIDTGYLRGVLDSSGRIVDRVNGVSYISDYWRSVVQALCDEVDALRRGE